MKSNKSYSKRLRVTKQGKIIARAIGHNHFNAKATGTERQAKNRQGQTHIQLDNTAKSRFLSQ
jgi:ribosomal protein L35